MECYEIRVMKLLWAERREILIPHAVLRHFPYTQYLVLRVRLSKMYGYNAHQGGTGYRGGRGRGRHGNKRGRDFDEPALDRRSVLLSNLLSLGDDCMPEMNVSAEALDGIISELKELSLTEGERVQSMFVRCIVQVHSKVSLYGVIMGIMNVEESEFVNGVLMKLVDCLLHEVSVGGDPFKAEAVLRFLASLVGLGLMDGTSLISSVLNSLIEVAEKVIDSSSGRVHGVELQPYADCLVRLVLGSLPFGGEALFDSEMILRCENYVKNRPQQSFPAYRPFLAPTGDDDLVAASECGAGGNLVELVEAVKEMQTNQQYSLDLSIPNLSGLLADNCYNVAIMGLPKQVASLENIFSAIESNVPSKVQMMENYPARGTNRLLKDEHTKGGRLIMDRLIAEDFFLHTMHFFEADRVECAKRLARAMPLKYPYEVSLCETIFGQMLRLPTSEHKAIMYGTLMVDLCKLINGSNGSMNFSRPMSACVKECFTRMPVLDPYLTQILAEWLAYHVSNYNFGWPWERWGHVLDASDLDYQKRFCRDVLRRMIRLSYHDRVNETLPENFRLLMPPKAQCQPLPSAGSSSDDLEGVWAAKTVELIRKKMKDEQLDEWMKEHSLDAVLGGRIQLCKMLLRALLVAGQKSYSHMIIALERYYGPLAALIQECGDECQFACMDTIWQVWSKNTQRAAMVIDRMMTLRLISAKIAVVWVFESGSIKCTGEYEKYRLAWDALAQVINKVDARVEDVKNDIDLINVDSDIDQVEKDDRLSAKSTLLRECEEQRSITISLVIERFVACIDGVIEENEELASFESLQALALSGLAEPSTALLYDLVHFVYALIRHNFDSVSSCYQRISEICGAGKYALTKSLTM
jgi:nuclear cap-binding protein subunit 1